MRVNKLKRIFTFLLGLAIVFSGINTTMVSAEESGVVKSETITVEQLASDGSPAASVWIDPNATLHTYTDGSLMMSVKVKGAGKNGMSAYLKSLKIENLAGELISATYIDVDENGFPTEFHFPIEKGANGVEIKNLRVAYMPFPANDYFLTHFPNGHEVSQKLSVDWDSAHTKLSDGTYMVDVSMRRANDPEVASMAAGVLDTTAILHVEQGVYTLETSFKALAMSPTLVGHVGSITYYEDGTSLTEVDRKTVDHVERVNENGVNALKRAYFTLTDLSTTDIYVNMDVVLESNPSATFMNADAIIRLDYGTLIEHVNKTLLHTKIGEAQAYQIEDYTSDSYGKLQSAIANANAVVSKDVATQAEVDEQVTLLDMAIQGLVLKSVTPTNPDTLADGVYEVPVALWHATQDKASMAASALLPTARIVIKDGNTRMYIYTQPMQFGTIVASLQELKISNLTRSYTLAAVETKDASGNPTSFSFVLPHKKEYLDVLVNPHVAMMGNQDISARLKIDYGKMKKVADDTDISKASEEREFAEKLSISAPSTGVNTADKTNLNFLICLFMIGVVGTYATFKKRTQE